MAELLEKHIRILRKQMVDARSPADFPKKYEVPADEWIRLRDEICDEIEKQECHRIPYVADCEWVNFLLLGIPCCLKAE